MIRKNFSKILLLIHSLQSASLFCPRPSPRAYRTCTFRGLSGKELLIYSRKSSTMFQSYGDATRRLIDHMTENLEKNQYTSIFEILEILNISARIIMADYHLRPCVILKEPEKKRQSLNKLREDIKKIVTVLRPILVHKIELTRDLNETLLPIIKNFIENPKIGASYPHFKLLLTELFNLILQAKTRLINMDLKIRDLAIVRLQLETLYEIRPIEAPRKKVKAGEEHKSKLKKSLAFAAKLRAASPLRTPTLEPAISSPLTTPALESSVLPPEQAPHLSGEAQLESAVVSVEQAPDLSCEAQLEDPFLAALLNSDNWPDLSNFSDSELS